MVNEYFGFLRSDFGLHPKRHIMRNYLQKMEDYSTKVTTTTGVLGTQADIVLFH